MNSINSLEILELVKKVDLIRNKLVEYYEEKLEEERIDRIKKTRNTKR